MQGPIDLNFLAPYVEAALDRAGIGIGVRLSGMRLGIDPASHELGLRADNVRVAAPDGSPLAQFPQTSMGVALGPLLEGRVAPTSLIVERPVLRLRRDRAGAVAIDLAPGEGPSGCTGEAGPGGASPVALDRLLSPDAGDPATLPHHVAIRGATVLIDDIRSGLTWRVEPVDIAIERGPDEVSGNLSLAMPLGASVPELSAAFRYSAATRRLDLDLSLAGALPAEIAVLVPELAPLRQIEATLSGKLRTRIDLAGNTAEATRVDLAIGNGRLRSELLPNGGIAIEGGKLHAAYDPERRELRLDRLLLDLGGGSELEIAGTVPEITPDLIAAAAAAQPSAAMTANLTAALRHVPAARLRDLWPASFSPGGRRWVLANVHDGVLDEASVQLAIALDPAARTADVAKAAGTLRYHDLTIRYLKGLEPVRKVSGRAVFDGDRLEFTPTGGWLRGLQVTGGSLLLSELGQKVEWLTVDLPVAGKLRDVLETIDAKPLGYARDIGIDPAKVAGRVETRLHFKLPLLDALTLAQVDYTVDATLAGVGIAGAALDQDISGGDFTLAIDKSGARLHGAARFADIPLRLDSELLFHVKEGPRARYHVTASLDDAARRRLGFEVALARLAGPVAIDATYTEFASAEMYRAERCRAATRPLGICPGGARSTSGSICARPRWICRRPAGRNRREAPPTARVLLDRGQDRFSRIRRVDAQAPGLQAVLSGRFTADGNAIERIDIHRLKLGDSDLAGTVARRAGGGWRADIHAPVLDARELLKKDKGGSAPEKSDAADDSSDTGAAGGQCPHRPPAARAEARAAPSRRQPAAGRRGMAVGSDRRAISGWRRPMAAPRRGGRSGDG